MSEVPSTDTKPWWASRTIIGAVIAALAPLGAKLGYQIDASLQSSIVDLVVTLVTVGGSAVAVWGRVRATKTIGKVSASVIAPALLILALLGWTGVAGGLSGCSTVAVVRSEASTPAQTVYALEADYASAAEGAAALIETGRLSAGAVDALRAADRVAHDALVAARGAVKSGDSPAISAAVAALRTALTEYITRYSAAKGA